jgi:phytoene dehydrogenase-like protein
MHSRQMWIWSILLLGLASAFVPNVHTAGRSSLKAAAAAAPPEEADVVVIGSGLAGLSCAALLAHCDRNVVVLESHDAPGGAAHTWTRKGFHFESGPSLYSGFSMERSPNPLKNIFQITGEDCEWITYDRWGTVLPNGKKFAAKIGPEEFDDVLLEHGGPDAVMEFKSLMERMKPLSDAAQALTSLALREDPAAIFTLLKYPGELIATLKQGAALNEPFLNVMEEMGVKNQFVKNWLDMLSFLLQGLPASGTMNAVMAYMLAVRVY